MVNRVKEDVKSELETVTNEKTKKMVDDFFHFFKPSNIYRIFGLTLRRNHSTILSALSPSSDVYLKYDILKPLFEYAKTIPVLTDFYLKEKVSNKDLDAECRMYARVFKDKKWPKMKTKKELQYHLPCIKLQLILDSRLCE